MAEQAHEGVLAHFEERGLEVVFDELFPAEIQETPIFNAWIDGVARGEDWATYFLEITVDHLEASLAEHGVSEGLGAFNEELVDNFEWLGKENLAERPQAVQGYVIPNDFGMREVKAETKRGITDPEMDRQLRMIRQVLEKKPQAQVVTVAHCGPLHGAYLLFHESSFDGTGDIKGKAVWLALNDEEIEQLVDRLEVKGNILRAGEELGETTLRHITLVDVVEGVRQVLGAKVGDESLESYMRELDNLARLEADIGEDLGSADSILRLQPDDGETIYERLGEQALNLAQRFGLLPADLLLELEDSDLVLESGDGMGSTRDGLVSRGAIETQQRGLRDLGQIEGRGMRDARIAGEISRSDSSGFGLVADRGGIARVRSEHEVSGVMVEEVGRREEEGKGDLLPSVVEADFEVGLGEVDRVGGESGNDESGETVLVYRDRGIEEPSQGKGEVLKAAIEFQPDFTEERLVFEGGLEVIVSEEARILPERLSQLVTTASRMRFDFEEGKFTKRLISQANHLERVPGVNSFEIKEFDNWLVDLSTSLVVPRWWLTTRLANRVADWAMKFLQVGGVGQKKTKNMNYGFVCLVALSYLVEQLSNSIKMLEKRQRQAIVFPKTIIIEKPSSIGEELMVPPAGKLEQGVWGGTSRWERFLQSRQGREAGVIRYGEFGRLRLSPTVIKGDTFEKEGRQLNYRENWRKDFIPHWSRVGLVPQRHFLRVFEY